jgi:hypothetical protein
MTTQTKAAKPSHHEIKDEINSLVQGNLKFCDRCQHSREVLDDIIADLIQYRDTLPSVEDYEG